LSKTKQVKLLYIFGSVGSIGICKKHAKPQKKERNLKMCALFGFVLGWVEFYMDGWLALGVSHTPSSIPFTLDGGDEEFDQK
jgi:hypothetical protein